MITVVGYSWLPVTFPQCSAVPHSPVHGAPPLEQQLHYFDVSVLGSAVQRGFAARVDLVNVGVRHRAINQPQTGVVAAVPGKGRQSVVI